MGGPYGWLAAHTKCIGNESNHISSRSMIISTAATHNAHAWIGQDGHLAKAWHRTFCVGVEVWLAVLFVVGICWLHLG
ncbi:hypothetical protein LY78DRAFT_251439 [Colletotrichum sublineola]|nr:hypothetical protein LY78DRAFT_251439 [Colletotrichum sublineola]